VAPLLVLDCMAQEAGGGRLSGGWGYNNSRFIIDSEVSIEQRALHNCAVIAFEHRTCKGSITAMSPSGANDALPYGRR
jgi:hypothetical protein